MDGRHNRCAAVAFSRPFGDIAIDANLLAQLKAPLPICSAPGGEPRNRSARSFCADAAAKP